MFGLYATLAKGDLRQASILENCVVLLGLTRVGKSTAFNWLSGK
jgi:hypothetical protein